jgi:glycosyltransferase involved in cell wall biosynthesis
MKTDKKFSVIISCSTKFHAFAMAEQFEKHGVLCRFYTTFASQKNIIFQKLVRRIDTEKIPRNKFSTNILIAFGIKIFHKNPFFWNNLFDLWVSIKLQMNQNFDVFIGWSGMSLHSIKIAQRFGKITILERGSAHIKVQNAILKDEYLKRGIQFSIDERIISKELEEYEIADYISIPSTFVKNSFVEMGIKQEKLIINPYGSGKIFFKKELTHKANSKFIVIYLGVLTVQKGLIYLFNAINELKIDSQEIEFWFIGEVSNELKGTIEILKHDNWVFMGNKPQHELPDLLSKGDIAIQPSLQDGFGMVINQTLACGLPTICTTNTGGPDIIKDGVNGFIVPIRSPEKIKEKIELLFLNPELLKQMKYNAANTTKEGFTWDDYGKRWVENLEVIFKKK